MGPLGRIITPARQRACSLQEIVALTLANDLPDLRLARVQGLEPRLSEVDGTSHRVAHGSRGVEQPCGHPSRYFYSLGAR
jgi:hypothetical protein